MDITTINAATLCGQHDGTYKEYLNSLNAGKVQEGPTDAVKVSLTDIGALLAARGQPLTTEQGEVKKDEYYKRWVAWATLKGDEYLKTGDVYTCEDSSEKCWEAVCRMAKFIESGSGSLDLSNLGLRTIPIEEELPPGVISLDLSGNRLMALPTLPTGLLYLNVNGNSLSELPELPSDLIQLSADNNKLKGLPRLPDTIRFLSVENNELKALPAKLPAGLEKLKIRGNEDVSFGDGQQFPKWLREAWLDEAQGKPSNVSPSVALYLGRNNTQSDPLIQDNTRLNEGSNVLLSEPGNEPQETTQVNTATGGEEQPKTEQNEL